MQFTRHGDTCVHLATKSATILTEPAKGAPQSDLATCSDDAAAQAIAEHFPSTRIISWPGEYEVQGIFVLGIPSVAPTADLPTPPTLFVVEAENIAVCHAAGITTKLSTEQVEQLGDIDVLLLPLPAAGGLDAATAKQVIEQIEPRVVVLLPENAETQQKFVTLIGQEPEVLAPLKLETRDLPEETMRYIILGR